VRSHRRADRVSGPQAATLPCNALTSFLGHDATLQNVGSYSQVPTFCNNDLALSICLLRGYRVSYCKWDKPIDPCYTDPVLHRCRSRAWPI
jgi:hypothetical protein